MNLDWHRDMSAAPRGKAILLLLGETIPEVPDIRVGSYIEEAEAESLWGPAMVGGGWLIWNSADDWFVVRLNEPLAWGSADLPDLSCWPVWRGKALA